MTTEGIMKNVNIENTSPPAESNSALVLKFVQLTVSEPTPEKPKSSKYRMELNEITHHNIKQLRVINQAVLPVYYNDKFYKDVLELGELAKLAYFNDIVVGAVCCRQELCGDEAPPNSHRLYILTLACLSQYRRMGVGTIMLKYVLDLAQRDASIHSVYLHVQINNEGAIEFYKRHGFVITERKVNYYKKIDPSDAYMLQKIIRGKENSPEAH